MQQQGHVSARLKGSPAPKASRSVHHTMSFSMAQASASRNQASFSTSGKPIGPTLFGFPARRCTKATDCARLTRLHGSNRRGPRPVVIPLSTIHSTACAK